MIDRLPFEIISEKSDLDWLHANPVVFRIDHNDFTENEEKREKAETIAKAGKIVLVQNGNEILGALVPKSHLMLHGLLVEDNTDGFFEPFNNRVFKQDIGKEEGEDILRKFDGNNQTALVFDNQLNPLYGFVSADFLKQNLVADANASCLFRPELRNAIEEGIQNWEHRFNQAFERVEKAQKNNLQEANENQIDAMVFIAKENFTDIIARHINAIDSTIRDDKDWLLSLISSKASEGNQPLEENTIGDP